MPALAEFPIIKVVHPAYHCFPNGGHGSFCPSARRRLSCVLVFATAPTHQLRIGFQLQPQRLLSVFLVPSMSSRAAGNRLAGPAMRRPVRIMTVGHREGKEGGWRETYTRQGM